MKNIKHQVVLSGYKTPEQVFFTTNAQILSKEVKNYIFEENPDNTVAIIELEGDKITKIKGKKLFLEIGTQLSIRNSEPFTQVEVTEFLIKDGILTVRAKNLNTIEEYRYKFHQIDTQIHVRYLSDREKFLNSQRQGRTTRPQPETKASWETLPILSYKDLVDSFDLDENQKQNLKDLVDKKIGKELAGFLKYLITGELK